MSLNAHSEVQTTATGLERRSRTGPTAGSWLDDDIVEAGSLIDDTSPFALSGHCTKAELRQHFGDDPDVFCETDGFHITDRP
ncbi:MAG: hypothetical protein ACXWLH_03415 [Candidatus Saccharimonadales bacterium]